MPGMRRGGTGAGPAVAAAAAAGDVVVAVSFHHILDEGKREALVLWG